MTKSLQEALRDMLGDWRPAAPATTPAPTVAPVNRRSSGENTPPVEFAKAMQGVVPLSPNNSIQLALGARSPAAGKMSTQARRASRETPANRSTQPEHTEPKRRDARNAPTKRLPESAPPRYPHLREPNRPQSVPAGVDIMIGPVACVWSPGASPPVQLLPLDDNLGAKEQLHDGHPSGTRELVMGLDFGTSGTKVVISDRGSSQAFAVPFRDAMGSAVYILPSTFVEDAERYSLHAPTAGARVHSSLKLKLLATPHDSRTQAHVAAFLALVIRRARAWLFQTRREEYQRTDIVWTLALGQPVDHGTTAEMGALYKTIGVAAWELAKQPGLIPAARAVEAVRSAAQVRGVRDDIDVLPMPEIAAQVYGFISSNQFDPGKRNIFLLADVGAGTLDACLFRVYPERSGGRWSLEVYTSAVKQHGVMNLHRYRQGWWRHKLNACRGGDQLASELDRIELPTEFGGMIPASYSEYVLDVEVRFSGAARGPDDEFYQNHVVRQVQGQTLYHAFSSGVLPKEELGHVPFFLCGGGARMPFYQQLTSTLPKTQNFGWLSAVDRELTLPSELLAKGLARRDFDRLSVAYGLSRLNLATACRALPAPRASSATAPFIPEWRERFIDKDQV